MLRMYAFEDAEIPDEKDMAFCGCWKKTIPPRQRVFCDCGEGEGDIEWNWEEPTYATPDTPTSVIVDRSARQVHFHPYYSSGTAAARGDTPLFHDYHYYWEVKLVSEAYGTDIMMGVGSDKVDMVVFQYMFNSLLGRDCESYGLSYHGYVTHNGQICRDGKRWGKGSVIGIRLDMFMGTLEFFYNRKPQGISFYNLKRHQMLYPMVCSTAANSVLRLIYTASWKASLLLDAAKLLAKSSRNVCIPPGLAKKLAFWMTAPPGEPADANDENVPRPLPQYDNIGNYLFRPVGRNRGHAFIFTQRAERQRVINFELNAI